MSLIALDLGSHAVKVTVFRRNGRKHELEDRYTQPVPQDEETPPTWEQRLVALDALLDDHPEWQSPGTEVVASWPTEQAVLHRLALPFTDKAQIEKTLPFTVEGEVPFDLDDVVLGYRVLEQGEGTLALVAILLRERFSDWLGELSSRQVDPKSVLLDGDALSLWSPDDALCAVIDVGHTHTVVSAVRGGVMQTTRAIDVGGREFTRAIQRTLGCDWQTAERIKHGQEEGMTAAAREAVDQAMGVLLAEIRSTLITAEDTLGDEIHRVYLTGGGAKLHPFADYLRQDLGVTVEPPVVDGKPIPAEHAEAHALATRLADGGGDPIELRIEDFAFRGGTDILKASAALLAAGVTFLTLASLVVFFVNYRSLAAEEARLDEQLKTVVTETFPDVPRATVNMTTAVSIMAARTEEAQARAAVMGGSDEPPVTGTLLAITEAFPPPNEVTVDVSELLITPTNISLTAETSGYTAASAVEESLQKHDRFKNAEKSSERKIRDKVSFSITIPLGTDDGEEG